jgi:hypothetical protein
MLKRLFVVVDNFDSLKKNVLRFLWLDVKPRGSIQANEQSTVMMW